MSDQPTRLHQSVYGRVNRAGQLVFDKGERAALDGFVGSLLPGTRLIVAIENQLPQRSLDALRYYFGAIVRPIAEESGYSERETHDLLVQHLLPFKVDRPWDESSLPLDFDRFSEYIDACIDFAAVHYEMSIQPPRRQPG